jgi:hypothetical protein
MTANDDGWDRGRDRDAGARAGGRLARAVLEKAAAAGVPSILLSARSHPWASITFSGGRHELRLSVPDTEAARAWIDALPEAEFRLPGLLVADLAVRRAGAEVEVEALVLDDD